MIRFLVLALGAGLPAWWGWTFTRGHGPIVAFLTADVCFALGWYWSRKFIREHLDL